LKERITGSEEGERVGGIEKGGGGGKVGERKGGIRGGRRVGKGGGGTGQTGTGCVKRMAYGRGERGG